MAMETELLKKIGNVEKALEEAKKAQSKATPPGVLFGFEPNRADHGWPDGDRLKRLADAYPDVAQQNFMRQRGKKWRGCGIGPALARMAKMANPTISVPDVPIGYNTDKLETDTGFMSIEKAIRVGKTIGGEVRKTALAENSGLAGGYLVPPQFVNELMTIAGEDAFVKPRAHVMPMTTRTLTIPSLDITTAQATGVTPYAGGIVAQWQPEAATISETEPQFRQTELTAYDLVMYTIASNQLLQDNAIGLDALLTQLFGYAMTWYEEYAYLRGTGAGSSMPQGIINSAATITQIRTIASKFMLPDVANMMSHLQMRSWDNACWIMHQSVLPQLIQMHNMAAGSNNGTQLVWLTTFGDSKVGPAAMKMPNAFFNGLPLYFTEKLPQLGTTGDVMLVDFSHYLIGSRLDVQIDVSPHFRFINNQLVWRVVFRGDGKSWLNKYITDAAGFTVSPFIVLSSATS